MIVLSNLIVVNVSKIKVDEWNMNLIKNFEIWYRAFKTAQSECSAFNIIHNILDFLVIPDMSVVMESIFHFKCFTERRKEPIPC
jgi:hypothetical protein